MALIPTIVRWFKRVFGVTSGKKVEPAAWRRATSAEKAKLGKADVKGPIYVQAKKVTKKSKSISKRQYDRLRNGGLSKEQITKSHKPVIKETKTANSYTYEMPLDSQQFTKQVIRIVKQFEHDKDAAGYLIIASASLPHPISSNLYLVNMESVPQLQKHLREGTDCRWYEVMKNREVAKYLGDVKSITQLKFRVWMDR